MKRFEIQTINAAGGRNRYLVMEILPQLGDNWFRRKPGTPIYKTEKEAKQAVALFEMVGF